MQTKDISSYSEAVTIAKRIVHEPHDKTLEEAAMIIRFIAKESVDYVPNLLAEIERLKQVAHEILSNYDVSARTVIDEVVGTGRELTLSYHEFLIKSYRNEINGGDFIDDHV